ncbi:MAG: hypothetical protein ACLTG4_05945 [Oscillospiraceae bacterium]
MSSSQRNWRCSATDKAANYLGLMHKAGRIALGEQDAGAAARAGKACLLLLAQDASTCASAPRALPIRRRHTAAPAVHEAGAVRAVGKTGCAIAAVIDPVCEGLRVCVGTGDPEQYRNTAAELAAKTEQTWARRRQAAGATAREETSMSGID